MQDMTPSNNYCFFKYRTINKYLLDSLVKSQLYFATRSHLNDPFDCNISIPNALDNLIKSDQTGKNDLLRKFHNDRGFHTKFDNNVEDLGICSFSLKPNETLMWSHYANNHNGVCLRYELSEKWLNNPDEIFGVSKVSYESNRISDWLKSNIEHYDNNHKDFIYDLLKTFLTSKAPSWDYEQEARIIRPVVGPCEIPRESLTHIIWGLKTTESDESLVRSIANKYYGSVKYGRAVRANDDYGINIVDEV